MTRPTLTRTEQVLKAVRKGGRIVAHPEQPDLPRLLDRRGNAIPAWLSALRAAKQQVEQPARVDDEES